MHVQKKISVESECWFRRIRLNVIVNQLLVRIFMRNVLITRNRTEVQALSYYY